MPLQVALYLLLVVELEKGQSYDHLGEDRTNHHFLDHTAE